MSAAPTRGNYLSTIYGLRTTDATATTLKSIPVYSGRMIHVKVSYLIQEEAAGDVKAGTIEAWFYDVVGTATAIGSQETVTVNTDGAAAWTLALAASGANAVLTATGEASANIRWFADMTVNELAIPSSGF